METYYFKKEFLIGEMVVQPVHIRIEELPQHIASHRHSHTSYEIHYVAKGRGMVKVEGLPYPVQENTLYVTGPDVRHEQSSDPADPILEYCLYLNCKLMKKKKKITPFSSAFLETTFWIGPDSEQVYGELKELIRECRDQSFAYEEMAEAILRQIIILLNRTYQKESPAMQKEHESATLTYAEHYPLVEDAFFYNHKTLRLAELAQILHLSERQTQRFLQEHYGKNFTQKRMEARMSAAIQLLNNPDNTIEWIAEETGYSSGEHFSTAFKKYYQQSPSAYRASVFRGR